MATKYTVQRTDNAHAGLIPERAVMQDWRERALQVRREMDVLHTVWCRSRDAGDRLRATRARARLKRLTREYDRLLSQHWMAA